MSQGLHIVKDENVGADSPPPGTVATATGALAATYCGTHRPKPCAIVTIGASGDLPERKIVPARFVLFRKGEMPVPFRVLECARTHFKVHQIFKLTSWWLMDLTAQQLNSSTAFSVRKPEASHLI